MFNETFLPNGSDERQQSGWIKAVDVVGLSLGGVWGPQVQKKSEYATFDLDNCKRGDNH